MICLKHRTILYNDTEVQDEIKIYLNELLEINGFELNRQVQIHRDEVNEIIDELKSLFKQEERAEIIADINGGFSVIKEQVFTRWHYIIEKEAKKLINSAERQLYIQLKTEYLKNKIDIKKETSLFDEFLIK
jgi:hypothetical protein